MSKKLSPKDSFNLLKLVKSEQLGMNPRMSKALMLGMLPVSERKPEKVGFGTKIGSFLKKVFFRA